MPDPKTTKVQESLVLDETDVALTLPKAHHLIEALQTRADAINVAINGHLHEVKHPSLMNPQIEHHQLQADLLINALAEVVDLRVELANIFGVEIDPIIVTVPAGEPSLSSPAEVNRPPSANPGAASSQSV